MKVVTAYIERERFDAIREQLLSLGFRSISAWEASGSIPEPEVTGSYRGAVVETHLRPKVRLECVAGAEHVSSVVDTVLEHGGERRFVYVVGVEQAYPTDTVKAGDALVNAPG